jgi:23S rRNA (guanine2445-N2)-methyltransferase / 23S rRNA (guanine2069-N7)-methyltransferase
MSRFDFFAPCPTGVADLLATELAGFGALDVREMRSGVAFAGALECAYRACLWSRTASRVLLRIGEAPADTDAALYDGVRAIDWLQHIDPGGTIAIDVSGTNAALVHTRFTAQRVKDAIVDMCRDAVGIRPSVDLAAPDVRINVRVHAAWAAISLDLAGEGLHRRGYRAAQGAAPIKENLAAAILMRSEWARTAVAGGALVDPLCGSGTFVIEAALIECSIAPQLARARFGFERWRQHDAMLWTGLVTEARAAAREPPVARALDDLIGYDRDPKAIAAAHANAQRAGVAERVRFERCELAQLPAAPTDQGLLVANMPYGERMGDVEELRALHALLGRKLLEGYRGWDASILVGRPELGLELGLRARRTHVMFNGPLECRLLRLHVDAERFRMQDRAERRTARLAQARSTAGATMFANRLRKNMKSIGRWAAREHVDCFRIYDADMPEYAFAIDLYGDGTTRWAYVQEYEAPLTVDADAANRRRYEVLAVVPDTLAVPEGNVYERVRRRTRHGAQYQRVATEREFHVVREGANRFYVNFTDHLDTGLFLDHRPLRSRIAATASGGRFLNLFGYTGAMTVAAATGGALATTTVDLSANYLGWAARNLELNGVNASAHELIRADCLAWLEEQAGRPARYDLAVVDPPTFSRSKRMDGHLDVQRDHVRIIDLSMRLMRPGGVLYFSSNFSRFRLDAARLESFDVTEITRETIPRDFERNARIHVCYAIRARASAT